MEVRMYGIANSYHAEVVISDREPDGAPTASTLWKCDHEHTEFREAIACAENAVRSWVRLSVGGVPV